MASIEFTGNYRSNPRWMGDFAEPDHVLRVPARIDAAQFQNSTGVNVTVTANTAASATSIPVTALSYGLNSATPIIAQGNVILKAGTTLYFGGAKVATLTADAPYGATTLTVAALPTALVSGDTANYSPFNTLQIPSGTFVGRTYAERDASAPYGPSTPASDDEQYLIVHDVIDARRKPDIELLRPNSLVKENYLPGYGTGLLLGTSASPTAVLTKIRSIYRCIQGTN